MIISAKPTVLVVEDDLLILLDARLALQDAGYHVIEAVNADEALEQIDARPEIDAVLSDVQMPGALDGAALAAKVRATRPELGIVLTTGAPRGVSPPPGVELIAKPYSGCRLVDALARASACAA